MTSSITLQRCANGVICLPSTATPPPDLSGAYFIGNTLDSDTAKALVDYVNGALGKAPTLGEVSTELKAASAELAPGEIPLP